MSVNTETNPAQGHNTVLNKESVYASLFEKINLSPASSLGDINVFLDDAALSEATAGERLTAAMQVFMDCIRQSGQQVEKLDKTLIDRHIAELDFRISRQLDAVMHHPAFQKVESLWCGLKQLVDNTDYRQNVKTDTRRLRVMSIMEIHHRVKHYGITWWVQRTGKERQAVHLQYPFLEGPRRGTAWTPACHELFFSSVPNYVWNANCR